MAIETQMKGTAQHVRHKVENMGCDHKSGADHLRHHILTNLKSIRKSHKRKLEYFVQQIQSALTDVYHTRRNITTHLDAHEDAHKKLTLASEVTPMTYDATHGGHHVLATLPQDPYLTANALLKDIHRAVDIENDTNDKLRTLFTEMVTWEQEIFQKGRLAMEAWKQWRVKMNQREVVNIIPFPSHTI